MSLQLAMHTCDQMHTERGIEDGLLQDNVALIVVLDATAGQGQEKPAEAPRRQLICVANTHIHANPELNDVKLWQVNMSPLPKNACQIQESILHGDQAPLHDIHAKPEADERDTSKEAAKHGGMTW